MGVPLWCNHFLMECNDLENGRALVVQLVSYERSDLETSRALWVQLVSYELAADRQIRRIRNQACWERSEQCNGYYHIRRAGSGASSATNITTYSVLGAGASSVPDLLKSEAICRQAGRFANVGTTGLYVRSLSCYCLIT